MSPGLTAGNSRFLSQEMLCSSSLRFPEGICASQRNPDSTRLLSDPIRKHGTLQLHHLYLTVCRYVLVSMIEPGVGISIQPYPAPAMKADVYTLVRASL